MDDDRRAVRIEERPRSGIQRDVREEVLHRVFRRGRNIDVRQIPRMWTTRIQISVLPIRRIEVAPC